MTDYDRTHLEGITVYPINPPESAHLDSLMGYVDHYALGINPHNGNAYMIHTEGVSYLVNFDKPFRFNDRNYEAQYFTLPQLARMIDKENSVDLTKWVRMHNDRLESNLSQARWALTNKKVAKKDERDADINRGLLAYMVSEGLWTL